jgi:dihydroorotase
MTAQPYDLLIRAGRVFCAATGLDGPGAVAVRGDRIAAGSSVAGPALRTLDFPAGILLPGLVDLHAHPGRGGSKYGVDPDLHFLPRGVTTVLSQGDAGAADWPAYRAGVIDNSRTRVRLAINLSIKGESNPRYCFEGLAEADVEACAAVIAEDAGRTIWGIALNTSIAACGETDARELMARALEVSRRTGRPLLFGSRLDPDWPMEEQLELLRPGDVLTYCFTGAPESILRDGRVKDGVWEARRRGILFDIGHGMSSFSFPVAEAAIAQGFWPDTISTDQYARHVGSVPQHDLPRTISKLIAAGLPETEALARATMRPAQVLGLAGEVGTLAPGACADLTVLQWNAQAAPLRDVAGVERPGACLEAVCVVRGGDPV